MTITILYTAVDGFTSRRSFRGLDGAKKFSQKMVGAHPEICEHYAVSSDGIGKVTVRGPVTLEQLFPDNVITYDDIIEDEQAALERYEREHEATDRLLNAEYWAARDAEFATKRSPGCTCSDMQLSHVGCDCCHAYPF
jgi:hypothetical protein